MAQHHTRYTLWVRQQIEVNTDPQRRCYNGCHAKSKMVWTDWAELCDPQTKASGLETMACFKKINPQRQYRLTPPPTINEPVESL